MKLGPLTPQRAGIAALCVMSFVSSPPAGAVSIDLSGAGGGGAFGNVLQFSAGGITVDAYGWAETGDLQTSSPANYYYFQTAELYSWDTGLGICNRFEGTLGSGNCDTNEREIDTVGRDDLLVLFFDQIVSFDALEITVDPWDGPGSDPNDRDLRYWIATVGTAPDLSGYSFNTLSPDFGTDTLSSATSSYNAYTHILHSSTSSLRTGNLLLIAGDFIDRNCTATDITSDAECESWKLKDIVVSSADQVVPVPAAAWLMGSAVGLLGLLRRRRS